MSARNASMSGVHVEEIFALLEHVPKFYFGIHPFVCVGVSGVVQHLIDFGRERIFGIKVSFTTGAVGIEYWWEHYVEEFYLFGR